jgi:hypothetical protein
MLYFSRASYAFNVTKSRTTPRGTYIERERAQHVILNVIPLVVKNN